MQLFVDDGVGDTVVSAAINHSFICISAVPDELREPSSTDVYDSDIDDDDGDDDE